MSDNLIIPQGPRLKNGIKPFNLSTLPKCGAKTRSGKTCQRYGTKHNGRCRLHGGRSTGPKRDTSSVNNPNFKTGYHTKKAKQQRKEVARLIKESRQFYGNT